MTQTGSMGLISAARRAAPQAVMATIPIFVAADKVRHRLRPGGNGYSALDFTSNCALIAPISTMATPAIDSVMGAPNRSSPMP